MVIASGYADRFFFMSDLGPPGGQARHNIAGRIVVKSDVWNVQATVLCEAAA